MFCVLLGFLYSFSSLASYNLDKLNLEGLWQLKDYPSHDSKENAYLASVSRTRHDTMYTRGLFADSCRKRSSSSRTLTKLCSDAQQCSQLWRRPTCFADSWLGDQLRFDFCFLKNWVECGSWQRFISLKTITNGSFLSRRACFASQLSVGQERTA